MQLQKRKAVNLLTGITTGVIIFNMLVFIKIIPYENTWGGRLRSDGEMYTFTGVSLLVNAFLLYVLLQHAERIKKLFSTKARILILRIFMGIFLLNTITNLLSQTAFEKWWAIVTFLMAFLLWKVQRPSTA